MYAKTLRHFLLLCFFSAGLALSGAAACIEGPSGVFTCDEGDVYTEVSTLQGDTLLKTGAGEIILTATDNIINDDVIITDGVLSISSEDNLGGDYVLQISNAALKTDNALFLANDINLINGTINVNSDTLLLNGAVAGDILNKEGEGALLLDGVISLGNINISQGILSIGDVLNISGVVDVDVAAALTPSGEAAVFALVAGSAATFSGNITGGGSFVKEGAGTLTLSGVNTVAQTHLWEGAIAISSALALQGDFYFSDDTELIINGNITLGGAHAQAISLSGGQANAGSFNVSAGSKLMLGEYARLSGADLVKTGAGTLFLNHDYTQSNYHGDAYIQDGALEIVDGNILGATNSNVYIGAGELLVSDNTNINRNIYFENAASSINIAAGKDVELLKDTAGAGALNKNGSGTLTVLQAQLLHTGGTNINEGALITNTAALSGAVAVATGADLIFSQTQDGQFLGAISGAGNVVKEGSGLLTLIGIYGAFSGTFDIREGVLQGNAGNLTGNIITAADTSVNFNQLYDDVYSNIISGDGSLIKTGLGALELTGINTYTGGTIIADTYGLLINDDENLGTGGVILYGGNLATADGSDITTARDFELVSGNGVNNITVGDGATYTIEGVLSGGSFEKRGAGTLILTAPNTHEGGTQITEGVLRVETAEALGTGMLSITGGTFNAAADMDLDTNIFVSGIAGFDIDAGSTLTTNGILFGGGTVNKKGAGTLVFGYDNRYMGGLNIEAGKVIGDTYSILGDITMTGGELDFNQSFEGWYVGDIDASGAAQINKNGEGLLIMEGDSNGLNALSIATFNINEGGAAALSEINGTINIAQDAFLVLEAGGSGAINATGALYISGEQNQNYTGDINIKQDGVLGFEVQEGQNNILAIDGNINFEEGSSLQLTAEGGFVSPQSFDLFSYSGILDGDFGDIMVINNRRLSATADMTEAGLLKIIIERILTNYSQISGLKYNQRQIARALDIVSAAPSPDMEFILNAIDDAAGLSSGVVIGGGAIAVGAAPALNQLAGLIYANIPLINSFNLLTKNAYLRINSGARGAGNNIWLQAAGTYAQIRENADAENLYNFSAGSVFGFDKYYGDDLRLGFAGSYTRHDLKHNDLEDYSGDEYQAGGYLLMRRDALDIAGAMTLGYRDGDIERSIPLLGRCAQSRLRSFSLNADTEASYNITMIGNMQLRPFAGLSGNCEISQSFSESGAGDADLSAAGQSIFTAAARAGIGLRKEAASSGYYGDISIRQNLVNPQTRLSIAGQDYTIRPYNASAVYGLRAGGYTALSKFITLYADFGGDMNSTMNNLFLNIGIRSFW